MGLVTLPGSGIQYFSFSEEITIISAKFFSFITNITPGWIVIITAFSTVFIITGILYRFAKEIEGS